MVLIARTRHRAPAGCRVRVSCGRSKCGLLVPARVIASSGRSRTAFLRDGMIQRTRRTIWSPRQSRRLSTRRVYRSSSRYVAIHAASPG